LDSSSPPLLGIRHPAKIFSSVESSSSMDEACPHLDASRSLHKMVSVVVSEHVLRSAHFLTALSQLA
jgi:hypothetical protein